jgi:phosphate transport system substrate-binding protein
MLIAGQAAPQERIILVGTGSSLPAPLYHAWSEEFSKQHKGISVRYLPIGTGESIHRILTGNGDFGGGDAPIPEKDLKRSAAPLLELPMILIGIVVIYHVPGVSTGIQLTGPVLADIFLGKIKKWNDPGIAKSNPGVTLPPLAISVVHRSEGKGSNYIFTDYLSKVSREFQSKVGRSTSPKWLVGDAFSRTEELIEQVKTKPGAIGYTELNWALKSGLPIARIRNAAGEFVNPSAETIAAAATATENKMTEDFRISLTNGAGHESYPISSFTWIYVPAKSADSARTKAVITFLNWALTSGQQFAATKGYAPLPPRVATKVHAKVATL